MRVLVTGGDGFTGKYLSKRLSSHGYEVVCLSNNEDEVGLRADLMDRESLTAAVEKTCPEYVIHLAAISFVGHDNRAEFYNVNVAGTVNLLEALAPLGSQLKKVVIASSANVYGNVNINILPISESQAPSPVNDYAASKAAMEIATGLWFDRLPILIVRPFNYTGVGQSDKFIVPKIIKHYAQHDSVIELGNLDISRDFSDVRDVARAYVDLMESAITGEVFNICSGKPISLHEIISHVEYLAGYHAEIAVNPDFVRSTDIKTLYGSDEKLVGAIGNCREFELKDTISWMFDAAKNS